MHNMASAGGVGVKRQPGKERKIIGDRGDFFLNRVRGRPG